MTLYDVFIIGGGPAGLSAALTLSRTLRRVVLFDSGQYRNANATAMHNMPTYEGQPPENFRKAARKEVLERYGETFKFVPKKVTSLKRVESAFQIVDQDNTEWHARKVILATGVSDSFPEIEGLSNLWGTTVIHCVYCHGTETRNLPLGVLLTKNAFTNQLALKSVTKKFANLNNEVTILANGIFGEDGEPKPSEELGIDEAVLELIAAKGYKWHIPSISRLAPVQNTLTGHPALAQATSGSSNLVFNYILHVPQPMVPPNVLPFLVSLGLQPSPTGDIPSTPPFGKTAADGVYVAGNAGLWMGTNIIAMAQGQWAALGVDEELGNEDGTKLSQ